MSAKNMSNNTATVFDNANKFVLAFIENLDILDEQDVVKITNAWKKNTEKFNELFVNLVKKPTRTKKAKDAPKNSKSAYMFFCQQMRPEVKEQNSDLSAKEINAKLGAMWKEIKDTDDADKYSELAAVDKIRYKEEMENYVPTESENEKPEKKKRAKKPKDAPKNAKSAYMFFCQEMRTEVKEENPNLSAKEITAKLGAMWKEIKETDDVEKYNELATADKDRYKEEMENYVPSEPTEDSEDEGKEKKKRAKKPKDAPKNAKSAYMFYCQEMRASVKEENPDLAPKEITTKLGAMWKEVKETDEVEKYNQMALVDKDRYKEEMEGYVPTESSEGETSEVENKAEKKKRTKKPKDAPKNAKSAYMFYCQEMRASVKEENPDLSDKEITIKLGEMWKEVKETDEVEKYNQMASSDKDRYKEEMENYVPTENNSEDSETESPKSSKKVDAKTKDTKEQTKTVAKESVAKEPTAKEPTAKKTAAKETKKTVKKQSNEDIVRDIIESCDGESITMKLIKDELKKKGIELSKDELKAIITKINEDDE
jgi:high mobility group protein B4